MIKDEKYEAWKDLVAKTARAVVREFPDVEAADLYQDMWLWVYSHGKTKPDGSAGKILRIVGNKAAWSYRKQHLTLNDQYAYRVPDVRRIVQNYLFDNSYFANGILMDQEVMGVLTGVYGNTGHVSTDQDGPIIVDAIRGNVPIDFTDRIVAKSDIETAFKQLSDRDRDVLIKIYRDGLEPTTAEARRAQRAIEKMTDYLNYRRGDHDTH